MTEPGFIIHPDPLYAFDDIIDGYFPLQVSLAQMMDRLGLKEAAVELRHAPIMHIPGLPSTSPVPLRIERGEIGQIDQMALHVRRVGASLKLSGHGCWGWHGSSQQAETFDPFTRLAEPAYITGFAFDPRPKAPNLTDPGVSAWRVSFDTANTTEPARNALEADYVLGPFGIEERIIRRDANTVPLSDQMWAILWRQGAF